VFNIESSRTQLGCAILIVMAALAGCYSPNSQSGGAVVPPSGGGFDDNQMTSPEDPSYGPGSGENLSEYTKSVGSNGADLTGEQQQQVRDLVVGFYDDMDQNRSERREMLIKQATKICEKDRAFDSRLNTSMLQNTSSETEKTVRRAHFAAQITNEMNSDVPVKPFGEVRDRYSEVAKYAPLLGSYNQLASRSCDVSRNSSDENIQEFQIAVVMFGVDAMLVSTGAFYQPAFAGTRFITNGGSQRGLYRLRYVCGDRCWALAMSEVHFALRGSMQTLVSNLARTSADMDANLTRADLKVIASNYEVSLADLTKKIDVQKVGETAESVKEDSVDCGQEAAEQAQESYEESTSNDSDGLLDGIDKEEITEKGEQLADDAESVVEDCQ